MRGAVFAAFAALLALTGCVGAFDPLQRPGNWVEEGSANETIAQQAAYKNELIKGSSSPLGANGFGVLPIDDITKVSQ